jgi:hypothetical protein
MTTGRNDACPCGSGKKFKKCCFEKEEAARDAKLAAEQAALPESLDPEQAARAKRENDAATRREGFQSGSGGAAPARRPSHARKRTV